MLSRRQAMVTLAAAGTTAALAPVGRAAGQAARIALRHFPTGEAGFFRAPVLLTAGDEALLVDGGFTLPDGRALAEGIRATGKRLTTVYVSQSDPDYYFGLGPVRAAFPQARIVAAAQTVDAIRSSVAGKVATWGPQLKENGPQSVAEVVIPSPSDAARFVVGGEAVDVSPADGLPGHRHLWVPSLRAVAGGSMIWAGLHVWTADTPRPDQRAAWIRALDAIAARQPAVVVPGHMVPNATTDASAIAFTRGYLVAFEEEVAKAKDGDAVIVAMTRRYPDAGLSLALSVGAKVAKGEMTWG